MEKHKLITIILKDLQELTEISQSLNDRKEYTKIELDIAVSKSKLINQEFEFLKELNEEISEDKIPQTSIQQPKIISQYEIAKSAIITSEAGKTVSQTKVDEKELLANEDQEEITKEKSNGISHKEKTEVETIEKKIEKIEKKDSVEETIGNQFIQEKTLNDLLIDSNTLDQKLANTPIEKLESAIGLNDRFHYIRELFDNKAELFQTTIQQIDQSQGLNEAVQYLNTNFQWQKTETSIRFAQLIKRRFSN